MSYEKLKPEEQDVTFSELFTTNPELDFRDIRNETLRIYIFPPVMPGQPNTSIGIANPAAVSFKAPERTHVGGGSHRIVDKSGKSFYIPAGWIGIEWEKDSGKPAYEW